jgi:hypothetical protein
MWIGGMVFAQVIQEAAAQQRRPPSYWDLCLAVGGLLGVVALGIWAVYKVKRWREESAAPTEAAPAQQLDHYQQMVADGLLDPEEFTRIKARLETQAPPTAPGDPAPPPDQPPDTSIQEK